jgi:hypothetical protein
MFKKKRSACVTPHRYFTIYTFIRFAKVHFETKKQGGLTHQSRPHPIQIWPPPNVSDPFPRATTVDGVTIGLT